MNIVGFATPEGTQKYRDKFQKKMHPDHFRKLASPLPPLFLSSLGLGTYLGEADTETDQRVEKIVQEATANGINVIDTAINYRFQRSERAIGKALTYLSSQGKIRREEILISTKGGFLPFDQHPPQDPVAYFRKNFVEQGLAFEEELVEECHCMSPRYIQNQIDTSLANLQLKTADIYYLHNPEIQLSAISRSQFYKRIESAFKQLEENVERGKIQYYGLATWNGFRANPKSQDYLSLMELIQIAKDLAGENHHFKALELPYNLILPEASVHRNQELNGLWISILGAAKSLGMMVMSSASLFQGRLSQAIPHSIQELFDTLPTPAQKAIQFVRSTPGITVALVGMKLHEHLKENLETLHAPLEPKSILKLLES
ncbi:MAG: aldo/keto reductase [Chlamydiae bacterium]|nr:aldo/keto reductase [Chlamydiota bacterium]MBI3265425.1 aldo/keto reductase [Chlamydiota bacterium]